ncbi:MAG: thioredoxin family protein [Bacilli bacterium]|nr:thioredoxin family protein [Bacilli bacterium]
MRKIFATFISLLMLFSISSCGNKVEKFEIETLEGITATVELTKEELIEKINNQDNFVLLLSQPTCGACANFKPIINEYVTQKGIVIYKIETIVGDLVDYKYTPTLAIFNSGEVVKSVDPMTKESVFSSVSNLGDFIEQWCVIPE